MADEPVVAVEAEADRLELWRARQFAGMSDREGRHFTGADAFDLARSSVDWHEVARLLARGCSVELVLRIVR